MDAGCWAVEHGNSIGEYRRIFPQFLDALDENRSEAAQRERRRSERCDDFKEIWAVPAAFWQLASEAEGTEKKVNDNRPILGINTSSVEGPKTWAEHPVPVTFYIQHLSGRLPTSIRFDPVLSKQGKFSLVFSPLPYANRPPHPTGMSFEVIEVGVPQLNAKDWERTKDTQKNLLDLFLYDGPKGLMRLDYPLISHFMDGDDPCSQAFCLRFEMDRIRFSADTTPCGNLSS
jgi:hypothetical protein